MPFQRLRRLLGEAIWGGSPRSWITTAGGFRLGILVSVLFVLVVMVMVAWRPGYRTVTPAYFQAVHDWQNARSLYSEGVFHYFPVFVGLFWPFTLLPAAVGDLAWRVFNFALFLTGIWRISRLLETSESGRLYALVFLLALPASLSAARNGQANMTLAGLMLHSTVDLQAGRLWRAALLLVLGVVSKPLGLVILLLASAAHWRLVPRVLLLLGLVHLPLFATQDPAYAVEQHRVAYHHLVSLSLDTYSESSDFSGALAVMGIDLQAETALVIRLLAAAAILAFWLGPSRALSGIDRALTLLGLSASYLMLFNPLTLTTNYVILSPVVGAMAAKSFAEDRWPDARALAAVAIGLGSDNYGDVIFHWTQYWWKPLLTLLFLAYLGARVIRNGRL